MGRDRRRWVYDIDFKRCKFFAVRIFNSVTSFVVLVQADSADSALKIAESEEPGYSYEASDVKYHRMYLDPKHLIN